MGFYQQHCIHLHVIVGLFICSALNSALSNWGMATFSSDFEEFVRGGRYFEFFFQMVLAWVVCALLPQQTGVERVSSMSWGEWFSVAVPCGIIWPLQWALGNLALKAGVNVPFYMMSLSFVPVFVLFSAFMLGLDRATYAAIVVVCAISLGQLLTSLGDPRCDFFGVLLMLVVCCLAGARWTIMQRQLQSMDPSIKTAFATLRMLAPVRFVGVFVFFHLMEGRWYMLADPFPDEFVYMVVWLMIHCFVSTATSLCELYLVMHSSAMVVMVVGVMQALLNTVGSMAFYHKQLSGINFVGMIISFLGVIAYKFVFDREKAHDTARASTTNQLSSKTPTLRYVSLPDGSDDTASWRSTSQGGIELMEPDQSGEVETPSTQTTASNLETAE